VGRYQFIQILIDYGRQYIYFNESKLVGFKIEGETTLGRLLGSLIILTIGLCLSSAAGAETLILNSGQKITGTVIIKNNMYVTLEISGTPMTYFIGEIASIDGKKIEIPDPGKIVPAPVKDKKTPAQKVFLPPVEKHSISSKPPLGPLQAHPAVIQESKKSEGLCHAVHEMKSKMGDMNNPVVVTTSDGGIIVITARKMEKYNKNLKLINAVDIKADNARGQG
jgi:hypothetical protein